MDKFGNGVRKKCADGRKVTGAMPPIFGMSERLFPARRFKFRLSRAWEAEPWAGDRQERRRCAPMKRKGRPPKEGICSDAGPKCANCRSKRGKCLAAAAVAAGSALPSPDEPSTCNPQTPQPAADSDMDDAEPRPSRKSKAPERFEVDANITSRATGQRWSAHSCCPNHMDAEPSTSEPAPKPKFTGPMDKYLRVSDKRVEAAVNRAAKSITVTFWPTLAADPVLSLISHVAPIWYP